MSFVALSEPLFDACNDTFGEPIIYEHRDGSQASLTGIFRRDYQIIREGNFDTLVSSCLSVLEIADQDLKEKPRKEDRITVRGELYRVTEVQPNSEGQTKLILKRVEKQ